MTSTIAVCLQTCNRADYTRRTVESFIAQHPERSRFLLLHGDDASTESGIAEIVQAAGFETVVQPKTRQGARTMRRLLFDAAQKRGAQWVLLLENDWEWVRPLPFLLFDQLVETRPDVYSLRLYGAYKGRNQTYPCSRRNLGEPRRSAVPWWPLPGAMESCEVGRYHWGAPPAVTRIGEALSIMRWVANSREPGDAAEVKASGRIDAYVARVTENVVYHIGEEKTRTVVSSRARPQRYTSAWQQTRNWTHAHSTACLLTALASCTKLPASLLDVGCGSGHLVDLARRKNIDAIGVDLSIPVGSHGALRHADLREPLKLGQSFPFVTCWEVAEHLPAEAADTLCDSLVNHLQPGGLLLFTAATPKQGGDGHINEQPHSYWREKLEARGLVFHDERTAMLRKQWATVAPRTPWYGKNLQVFRRPSAIAQAIDVAPSVDLPRVAITMRTADRSPNPNYLGGTVRRLLKQGVGDLHLCVTDPDTAWLDKELGADRERVAVHVPEQRLTPNQNGLAQIRNLDPSAFDWVLLLEDDLVFCSDFVGSVQRWLVDHAKPNRHFYRLFGFRVAPPNGKKVASYDASMQKCAGSQAVLLRMADAQDFLTWADANLESWGGFRGNARIAFDKLLMSWLATRYGDEPGVMSSPMFVKHIGKVSSLHPKTAHMDSQFAGESWSYRSQVPPYRVPKLWPGETFVVIGGGTVTQAEVDAVRGHARVIAINDAYRLAPWAECLYAADVDWWRAHEGVPTFEGAKYAIAHPTDRCVFPADVKVLRNTGGKGLETDPSGLRMGYPRSNSGYQAIQLAVHLGAARIVLLGYDMQPLADGRSHWFGDHPDSCKKNSPYPEFRESFAHLVAPLKSAGVEVINASTHTALKAFPIASLNEALALEAVA